MPLFDVHTNQLTLYFEKIGMYGDHLFVHTNKLPAYFENNWDAW